MPPREQTLNLRIFKPGHAPAALSFPGDKVTIGRSAGCSIPIADNFLSRQHAEILRIGDRWFVADSGSSNGTFLNGARVEQLTRLEPGDVIQLGENELVYEEEPALQHSAVTVVENAAVTQPEISLSAIEVRTVEVEADRAAEGPAILNRLALELLEEKPMEELFDFIVEKLMGLLEPSRAAIAILAPDRKTFSDVTVRCADEKESGNLTISQTMLHDVVENRKVLSFTDVAQSANLAEAKSIIGQSIRSALCAPLVIQDNVVGVLYMDYVITQHTLTQEDVRLAAQVARIAARKLETTRLREEAIAKQRMDSELETAFLIQSRLLPASAPSVDGFRLAGQNRPCRTVSGDYYDFVVRPDGRVYVIIADVSGKGITAALVMAGVAAAFNTLADYDHGPAHILSDLNRLLERKTDASMFVTAFCFVLEPQTGMITFSNAGHDPPFVIAGGSVERLEVKPGLALGLIDTYEYVEDSIGMAGGSSIFFYTDGITEATNGELELFTAERLRAALAECKAGDAKGFTLACLEAVDRFAAGTPQADDMTIVCIQRLAPASGEIGDDTSSFDIDDLRSSANA